MTPTQARLLRTLVDDVPQGRLAEQLALDSARVSALTGALERRGLLERVPSRDPAEPPGNPLASTLLAELLEQHLQGASSDLLRQMIASLASTIDVRYAVSCG